MGDAGTDVSLIDEATGGGAKELDYDFCYGPAFAIEPTEVARIAKALSKDPDPFGISEFFAGAAREGKAIVGGVS